MADFRLSLVGEVELVQSRRQLLLDGCHRQPRRQLRLQIKRDADGITTQERTDVLEIKVTQIFRTELRRLELSGTERERDAVAPALGHQRIDKLAQHERSMTRKLRRR